MLQSLNVYLGSCLVRFQKGDFVFARSQSMETDSSPSFLR